MTHSRAQSSKPNNSPGPGTYSPALDLVVSKDGRTIIGREKKTT